MPNDLWKKAISSEVCFWILSKYSLKCNPEKAVYTLMLPNSFSEMEFIRYSSKLGSCMPAPSDVLIGNERLWAYSLPMSCPGNFNSLRIWGKKKKSHLKTKINVQRQSPERSSHGKHALFSLLPLLQQACEGERVLQSKPIRSRKATPPLRGRIMPEMQGLKVCKQHAGLALAPRVRVLRVEALKTLLWNFIFS